MREKPAASTIDVSSAVRRGPSFSARRTTRATRRMSASLTPRADGNRSQALRRLNRMPSLNSG
jgi:hypothetical protein